MDEASDLFAVTDAEHRGGLGVIRQYRLLAEEAVMQLRTDRYTTPPYGLFGGNPGALSRNLLTSAGTDNSELLPSKITRTVRRGDVIRHEQAGGGGYGPAHERDPARVLEDVLDGKITPAYARDGFGVVVRYGAVDAAATAALRQQAS